MGLPGRAAAWAQSPPPTPLSGGDSVVSVPTMRAVLVALVVALVSVLRSRVSLHLEVLALRHQLAVLQGGGRHDSSQLTACSGYGYREGGWAGRMPWSS